jgi:uncharacterized membrane protein YebE (DUF533 family)
VADTLRLLDTLVRTGFGGPAPGAPLEGPSGAGPSNPKFEGLMGWIGESLAGQQGPAPAAVEAEGIDEDDALLVVRAMIAAARADGRIDEAERARIGQRLAAAGLGSQERALLDRELAVAAPFESPTAATANRRLAPLLYAASLRSVDPAHPAARRYLERLAQRLQLSPERAAEIQGKLGPRP